MTPGFVREPDATRLDVLRAVAEGVLDVPLDDRFGTHGENAVDPVAPARVQFGAKQAHRGTHLPSSSGWVGRGRIIERCRFGGHSSKG